MYRLLETIKVSNGVLQNIEMHNIRFNTARRTLFKSNEFINLAQQIPIPPTLSKNQLYKCRMVYSDTIHKIEFLPYKHRRIKRLIPVCADAVDYSFKYENRSCFDMLKKQVRCTDEEDILIIKHQSVTDTSFSNIAVWFFDKWLTPAVPLLKGTKREQLLIDKKIYEAEIKISDLRLFSKIRLINAMLDLEDDAADVDICMNYKREILTPVPISGQTV